MDNLARCKIEIETGLYNKEKIIAAFLNVTSAYDNINKNILIRIMEKKGCPRKIAQFVYEWMSDRNIKFIINNEITETRVINKGLPQGDVLSPTLYAVYTKDILKGVSHQIMGLQYTDDIAIINKGKDIR